MRISETGSPLSACSTARNSSDSPSRLLVARGGEATSSARSIEYDGEVRLRETVNVPQGRLDALEQRRVARLRFSADLADVEVMDLSVEDVLKAATDPRELEFLDDLELLQRLQVAIDAGSVDAVNLAPEMVVNLGERDAASAVVQDELKEHSPPGRDAHPVRSKEGDEIPMPLHVARCCNSE
jgi:hypothetical protein